MVYSVQVKRLRREDPIEALVVRGAKRQRSETDGPEDAFVFRLARTYDSQQEKRHIILEGSSTAGSSGSAERVFAIASAKRPRQLFESEGANGSSPQPKVQSAEQNASAPEEHGVDPELQSMIAEYIGTSQGAAGPGSEPDEETEDYVYDIYFSDKKAGPVTEGTVGYIEVDEFEERLLFSAGQSDSEGSDFAEDEDSNAEDFYRNDYPDEDEYESEDEAFVSGDGLGRRGSEFGSDLDELLWDPQGDLHEDPSWTDDSN